MAETIFLVRHGESTSNAQKIFAGWKDVSLTPLGRMQAQLLKRRLQKEGIGRVFCSTSLRTRQTCELIGLKCPVEYSDSLRETNYGEMEGVRWGDDEKRYERYHSDPSAKAPGGENAHEVQKRVLQYFNSKVFNAPEEKVLVVSHHNPIVGVSCHMLGMQLDDWRRLRLGNCGLCIFTKEGNMWRLKLWNSLSHYGLENFQPLFEKDR